MLKRDLRRTEKNMMIQIIQRRLTQPPQVLIKKMLKQILPQPHQVYTVHQTDNEEVLNEVKMTDNDEEKKPSIRNSSTPNMEHFV